MDDEKKIKSEVGLEEQTKIKELIASGKIKAISVDTTVFNIKASDLKTGFISQLAQFDEGNPVTFVISKVVCDEVKTHLSERRKDLAREVNAGIRSASFLLGKDDPAVSRLRKKIESMKNHDVAADDMMNEFLSSCNADVADITLVDVEELFNRYFSKKAPFSGSGNKSEFPDAAALESIKFWADMHDTDVVVVSRDKAWQDYVSEFDNLHLVKNLDTALSLFQQPDNRVEKLLAWFLNEFNKEDSDVLVSIEGALWGEDWFENSFIEKSKSGIGYVVEEINIDDVISLRFSDQDQVRVVRVEKSKIGVKANLSIEATFDIRLSAPTLEETTKRNSEKRIAEISRKSIFEISALIEIPFKKINAEISVHIERIDVTLNIGEVPANSWYEEDEYLD